MHGLFSLLLCALFLRPACGLTCYAGFRYTLEGRSPTADIGEVDCGDDVFCRTWSFTISGTPKGVGLFGACANTTACDDEEYPEELSKNFDRVISTAQSSPVMVTFENPSCCYDDDCNVALAPNKASTPGQAASVVTTTPCETSTTIPVTTVKKSSSVTFSTTSILIHFAYSRLLV